MALWADNLHYWARENPYGTLSTSTDKTSFKVWCLPSITGVLNYSINNETINANSYCQVLNGFLNYWINDSWIIEWTYSTVLPTSARKDLPAWLRSTTFLKSHNKNSWWQHFKQMHWKKRHCRMAHPIYLFVTSFSGLIDLDIPGSCLKKNSQKIVHIWLRLRGSNCECSSKQVSQYMATSSDDGIFDGTIIYFEILLPK